MNTELSAVKVFVTATPKMAFFENIWLLMFSLAWLQLRMFVNSSANVKTNKAKDFRSSNEK